MYTNKIVDGVEVPLTQDEIDEFEARDAIELEKQKNYDKNFKYLDLREDAYNKQGASDKYRLNALWDRIAYGDPSSIATFNAIETIRQKVQTDIPAPIKS